jgi:hypothetical protein
VTGVIDEEQSRRFGRVLRGIQATLHDQAGRRPDRRDAFLLSWSMANLGSGPIMLIAAGIAGAGAGLSQWLAPETKGKASPRRPPGLGTNGRRLTQK